MKRIKFIKSVNIKGKLLIYEGEEFDVPYEDENFLYIDMNEIGTVKVPKSEIDGIIDELK